MADSPPAKESDSADRPLSNQPRRGFFASAAAIVVGGLIGLVPLITGTLFFLDPLIAGRRKKKDGGDDGDEGFIKVDLSLEDLKASPVPVQVPIIASKVDKWNRYPDQPIGSVYLQADDDGNLTAFNVTCPHLGCAVEYRETPAEGTPEYFCPCHNSAFQLDGEKKNPIPPRDLDSLEVKTVKNDEGTEEIWVKYQEFRATLPEKVVV